MLMQDVVVLSDRFLDRASPEGIDRQEKLVSCIALICLVYLVLTIAIVELRALEKKRRIFPSDPTVSFELMIAPPRLKSPLSIPTSPALEPGKSQVGGAPTAVPSAPTVRIPALHVVNPLPEQVVIPHRFSPVLEAPPAQVANNTFSLAQNLPPPDLVSPSGSSDRHNQGSPSTQGSALDPTGQGSGAAGAGAGAVFGNREQSGPAGGPVISTELPSSISRRDIGPYRAALIEKVVANWLPGKHDEAVTVMVRLAPDGRVLDRWVLTSTGKRASKAALNAVDGTTFDHLPSWFRADELTFRIQLLSNLIDR